MNPLHPRMLSAKFGRNWLSGSGEENFLILPKYFCYFVIISPWKRAGPSFEQNWIPSTQGCFVPNLVQIGPVVLEKKIKLWKVYEQKDRLIDGQTDDGRSEKLTWAFSFLLLQNNLTNFNQIWHKACAKFGWNWSSCSGEEDF